MVGSFQKIRPARGKSGGPVCVWFCLQQAVDLGHVVLAVNAEDLAEPIHAHVLGAVCVNLLARHVVGVLCLGGGSHFDAQLRQRPRKGICAHLKSVV